jgi:hypothetical protein
MPRVQRNGHRARLKAETKVFDELRDCGRFQIVDGSVYPVFFYHLEQQPEFCQILNLEANLEGDVGGWILARTGRA